MSETGLELFALLEKQRSNNNAATVKRLRERMDVMQNSIVVPGALLALACTGEHILWNNDRITLAEMEVINRVSQRLLAYVNGLAHNPTPFVSFVKELQSRGLYV